jgi:hypothetical protein
MKLTPLIRLLTVVLPLAGTLAVSAAPPPGFVALYNGKDLSGWRGGDTFDHRK